MKEEDHGQIEFEPKDGLDILDYSDFTLSTLCGCIDLDLESVVYYPPIIIPNYNNEHIKIMELMYSMLSA